MLVADALAATIDLPPLDVAWEERLRRILHGISRADSLTRRLGPRSSPTRPAGRQLRPSPGS